MRRNRSRKSECDNQLARRKLLVERLIYESVDAMEIFLEESLQDITWPRETSVAHEVQEGGMRAMLGVDLPEIEDMPTKLATVPARGLKLSVNELSATKVKRLYAEHVHGIVFRLVGEAFAALPTLQWVCVSGYAQVPEQQVEVLRPPEHSKDTSKVDRHAVDGLDRRS
ncbi:MAG: hypothetical protein M3Y67_04055 [Pseudomonadota bacterium]|nr:hypothetical protein [Pseudomonadota bacterium]